MRAEFYLFVNIFSERLQVIIPWMNLNTKPTEVHISGLYLLIVPKSGMYYDH